MSRFANRVLIAALFAVAVFGILGEASAQTFRRKPFLQLGTPTSASVCWRIATQTSLTVRYGTDSTNLNLTSAASVADSNACVSLTGLSPATTYYYKVYNGVTVVPGATGQYLRTHPVANSRARHQFWVIGDFGAGTTAQAQVRDAFIRVNGSPHIDGVLMLGDNVYDNGTDAEYSTRLFPYYENIMANSFAWPVIGNHDAATSSGAPYLAAFTLPSGGQSGGVASGSEYYYSFDYGNIHFVCLDSQVSNRTTSGPQYLWLQQDLQANTKEWLVVMFHHPPYTRGSHNSETELNHVQMRYTFMPLLESYGVDLVLGGHSHIYERSYLIDSAYGANGSSTTQSVHDAWYASNRSRVLVDSSSGDPEGTGAYRKNSGPNQGTIYSTVGSGGKLDASFTQHPMLYTQQLRYGSAILEVEDSVMTVRFIDSGGVRRDYYRIVKPSTRFSMYYATATLSYPVGFAITNPVGPTANRTGATYSVTTSLPAGLSLNASTGRITGTPATLLSATDFAIVGAHADGSDTAVVRITLTAGLPHAPTGVAAQPGAARAYVSWTAPAFNGGSAITGYTVVSAPGGATCTWTSGPLECTVGGLTNGVSYTFTVHAANAFGTGSASAASAAVTPGPAPVISYSGAPFVFVLGREQNQPASNSGVSAATWAISPDLNELTGLNFDPTTGRIYGTPVSLTSPRNYVVSATSATGKTNRLALSIATQFGAPDISYASPQVYPVGRAIALLSPSNAGGPVLEWSITPSLASNTGLFFNPATGKIGGTPTTASPATSYSVITLGYGGLVDTAVVNVATTLLSPDISYAGSPYTYAVGSAISTLSPLNTGAPVAVWTITPNLAANTGLLFNPTTGRILGTPVYVSSNVDYTVVATGAGGASDTAQIRISTTSAAPTVQYPDTLHAYPIGTEIAPLSKSSATGIIRAYEIAPALPAGLLFNPTTGRILGKPSTLTSATDYVVTAIGPGGTGRDTIRIATVATAPSVSYSNLPQAFTVGVAASFTKTGVVGNVTGYAITPGLPAGLLFNATTGAITGSPTAITAPADYVVTVSGPGGTGKDTVRLATTANPPQLAFAQPSVSFVTGTPIEPFRPANAGGPVTGWGISSGSNGASLTANTGLLFNPTTGKILGTPVYVSAPRDYTVTANGLGGTSDSEVITIATTAPMGKLSAGEANTFSFRVTGSMGGYNLRVPDVDAATEKVTVTISELSGRRVWSRSIDPRLGAPMGKGLEWDGRDEAGRAVALGMYLVRIEALRHGKTTGTIRKGVALDPR